MPFRSPGLACGLDHVGSHYLQPVEHEDTLDLRQQPMQKPEVAAGDPDDSRDGRSSEMPAAGSMKPISAQ